MQQVTYSAKKGEVVRKWYVVDLKDQVLGRAATRIADILRGKNKPQFTPHMDTGDFVVVLNAASIKLTGKKGEQKIYYTHSGYPGGVKAIVADDARKKKPEMMVHEAVKGMLPKNILSRRLITKLKVYKGAEHPHAAQMPEVIKL